MAPKAKITDAQVAEIRASSEPYKVLAAEYGISEAHVCRIKLFRQRLVRNKPTL